MAACESRRLFVAGLHWHLAGMKGLVVDDQVGTNHEGMRLLILSRFDDDVLLRQDVEAWLDEVVAPGEEIACDCEELGLCYCTCKKCEGCGKVTETAGDREGEPIEEAVEIEVVPGVKVLAKFWKGRTG